MNAVTAHLAHRGAIILSKHLLGIAICILQAILILNAHSHSISQLTHHDSDYFVRPVEQTTGLVYAGQYHHPKHPDNWKWITLGEYAIRYRGQILIYRYCADFQHRGHPKHHHRDASGRHRWLTFESWRVNTHPSSPRPLCSCYRWTTRSQLKKMSLRNGSSHYIIYYRGDAEIHKDEDEKTEHQTNAQPKPKRKLKRFEPHSRTRSRNEKFERNRKEKHHRSRLRCGISSFHNHQ